MTDILTFNEYPPEKVFEAQALYCVDRLTFEAVAERTGVSVATLKRWSDKYEWRVKRQELAETESQIRVDTLKARATMLAKVVDKGDHFAAFAAAKLEAVALDQAKFKSELAAHPAPVKIESPAQAAELLEKALGKKMGALLAAPGTIDLKVIKDLRQALELLNEMKSQASQEISQNDGLSLEIEEKIKAALEGKKL